MKKIYCQVCSDDYFNADGELMDNAPEAKYIIHITDLESTLLQKCAICKDCFKDREVSIQCVYNSQLIAFKPQDIKLWFDQNLLSNKERSLIARLIGAT